MDSEPLRYLVDRLYSPHHLKTYFGLELRQGCVLRFFVSLMIYPFLCTVPHLNYCLKFGIHFRIAGSIGRN